MDVQTRIDRYVTELQQWGKRINLVGSTDRGAIELHLRDSLAAASVIREGARVADLGSGAGLPGLPLAIARPDIAVVLVEIRERRVHFLRHVIRTLGLSCEVRRQRIELGPAADEALFDVVTARAVGPAGEVLRQARPWTGESGEVWIWTRETPAELGVEAAESIAIDANGDRGRILRVRAGAIPRGTSLG